jgi:hypothetical protein
MPGDESIRCIYYLKGQVKPCPYHFINVFKKRARQAQPLQSSLQFYLGTTLRFRISIPEKNSPVMFWPGLTGQYFT